MKKIILLLVIATAIFLVFQFVNFETVFKNIDYLLNKDKVIAYDTEMNVNEIGYKSNHYYYSNLTDSEKTIYALIANSVKELKGYTNLYGYTMQSVEQTKEECSKAIETFLFDHPEVFYLNNSFTIEISSFLGNNIVRINLSYNIKDEYTLKKKIREINDKVDSTFYLCSVSEEIEKEIYFFEQISQTVQYAKDTEIVDAYHSIEGPFLLNKAVCDGFAKSLQLLLNKAGIETVLVTGEMEKESHAWLMVKLENEWYHTDVTSSSYSSSEGIKIVSHAFLNLNEDQITKTHQISKRFTVPKSQGKKYNYFRYKGDYISYVDNLENSLKRIVEKQKGAKYLEFGVDKEINSSNLMMNTLYDINFNNVKNQGTSTTIKYYNISNSFVVLK